MTFGGGNFGATQALTSSGELSTSEVTDLIAAPSPGATASLSSGPLVEANLSLFNAATNEEYVLGLDFFEVLGVSPGEVENIRIPAGTGLRAQYFYYESQGLDGTTPAVPLPASETITQSRRFASMMKFGG